MSTGGDRKDAARPLLDLVPEIRAMMIRHGLVGSGGVHRWEREAAASAVTATRKLWLDVLRRWEQQWYKRFAKIEPGESDYDKLIAVDREIKRLRRALGIKPSADEVRRQTRERVQAYRERRR